MNRRKPSATFLSLLLMVWASQILYLWPAPPFVEKASVEQFGGLSALWMFYLKWLGLVAFGFFGAYALYRRSRFWPAAVALSSTFYLWMVQFPEYVAAFFMGIDSTQEIPGRLRLLIQGLSDVTLLHMQFISPIFLAFAAIYAVVSYVRSRSGRATNVVQSGI